MPPGLYGRQREWERVLSALDLAQRGFGSVVLIEGRPGTGKTRLLQEAARAAWLRGFTMIERCRFGPDGAGAQTPAWLAEQLHTRIEEQAASGPVLIALDDVRASDAAWLPMSDLLPQQSRHPVMWMLTRNCAAGDPWFDQILGIPRAFTTRIELGPLPDSAHLYETRLARGSAHVLCGRVREGVEELRAVGRLWEAIAARNPDAEIRFIARAFGLPEE